MSNPPTPSPRPALRKAPDGSVHPASPVLSSLAVSLPAAGVGTDPAPGPAVTSEAPEKKGKKNGKGSKKRGKPDPERADETVVLEVELAKPVRKALRKRASDYGWTAEQAAAAVLRVWADG